jgi:hypothetical protein
MMYGYGQWRKVMLNKRKFAVACNEQANKNSPTRRSKLVEKIETEKPTKKRSTSL